MKATFEHSVDILVKAYMNDTLAHGYCPACAVGNLCAAAKNFYVIRSEGICSKFEWTSKRSGGVFIPSWDDVFITINGVQRITPSAYFGIAKEEIDATGYSWQELARIEWAFESADRDYSEDEWMFNGLMAVVDVLAEIHGVSLEAKETAVGRFAEIHATK